MRLKRIIFTYLFLLVAFQFCFAQEKPKPTLMDEVGRTSCADIQTRVSNSLSEALQDSNSHGYVIIYGKKNDLLENLRYESWIKGITQIIGEGNRIRVVRGEEKDELTVQVWKVPTNSNIESFSESAWSLVLSEVTKPFVFTNSLPEGGICPVASQVKLFADFLKANPDARAHLVIYDKTSREFSNKEKEISDELVNQYKVPRHRLKFFYVKDKDYPYKSAYTEFWLVPKKKNS